MSFFSKARRDRIILPRADVHVPQVGQFRQHGNDLARFTVVLHPVCAEKFIHGKTNSDGAGITHSFFCIFDEFAQEACAVFKRAAVFVGAVIVFGEHVKGKREVMRGIAIDNVEARPLCADSGSPVPLADLLQVVF